MRDSPFRHLRLMAGVNQSEMARQAGVTRQTLATLEVGMYDMVPIKANKALSSACSAAGVSAALVLEHDFGASTLNAAMDLWKQAKRESEDLSGWPAMSLPEIVRKFASPRQFCDRLCIPTYALQNGLVRDSSMPAVIITALQQAGYTHVDAL